MRTAPIHQDSIARLVKSARRDSNPHLRLFRPLLLSPPPSEGSLGVCEEKENFLLTHDQTYFLP